MSSNGFLLLTGDGAGYEYSNTAIPLPTAPNGMIAGFWDDLDPSFGGTVHYGTDPSGSRFVVQYDDVPHCQGIGDYTFQIVLDEDGTVLVQYLDMNGTTTSATVGVENFDGSDGLRSPWTRRS